MAYKRNKKEFFFPSVYMKMNWTFNYLKVMGRIQPIFWKKKEREKKKKRNKERKKTKIFISIYLFFYMYIWKWTRRVGQSSDFILILSNIGQGNVLEIRLSCKKLPLTRQNKRKMAIVNEGDKKK